MDMYQPEELNGLKPVHVAAISSASGANGVKEALITFDDGSIWLWTFLYNDRANPGGGRKDSYGKWIRIFQHILISG